MKIKIYVVLLLALNIISISTSNGQSGGGKTVVKNGLSFSVLLYTSYGTKQPDPENNPDWYAPVFRTGDFQIRCIAANYQYNGKTYTMSSFGGKLSSAFTELRVTEVNVRAIFNADKCGNSPQITGCMGSNESRSNALACGYKKGQAVTMTSFEVTDICTIEGLNELNEKIRELEKGDEETKKKEEAKNKIASGDGKFARGDIDGALNDYEEAKRIDPSNPYIQQKIENAKKSKGVAEAEKLMESGDEKLARGDIEGAKRDYEAAKKLNPDNSRIQQKLDNINKSENGKKEAEEHIKKGDELMAKGDVEGAKAEYNKALSKDPDNSNAKNKLKEAEKKSPNNIDKNGSQTPNQVDEEKKKREEEQKRLDDERKAREQAERERLERQKKYYEEQSKIKSQNEKAATSMGMEALAIHYMLGKIIYKNLGEDKYENVYKSNNYKLSFYTGYSFTSIPTFFNSSIVSYDGNNYSYDNTTLDDQSGTFDLQGGVEFWPYYGGKAGMGIFGNIGGGHGLLFQQFHLFSQAGIKAYIGHDKLKLYSEFSYGGRKLSNNDWIDPNDIGYGKTKYSYQRLKIGPRFTYNSDFMGETKCNLDVLPMFELPSFKTANYMNPINIRWLTGLSINMNFDNRLLFFTEYFWNYQRSGEVKYNYSKGATFAGTFFRFGVLRNFDFFGKSTHLMPVDRVKAFKEQETYKGIMFFSPSFGWIRESSNQLYIRKPNLGTRISYEHDIRILRNTNALLGIGFSINNGGYCSDNTPSPMNYKYGYSSFMIPTALRSYLTPESGQKYWLCYGMMHHFAVAKSGLMGLYGSLPIPGMPTIPKESFKTYIPCYHVGAGIDFKTGPYGAFRVGVSYERSIGSFYTGNPMLFSGSPYQISSNQLTIQVGVIF